MKTINVDSFELFDKLYKEYSDQKKEPNDLKSLIFLFSASDDPQTKESWCSDCRNSKPIIDKTIETFQFNEQIILAKVQVGQRDDWKSKDNPFRVHPLQISAVPTLLSLKNVSTPHDCRWQI